MNDMAQVTLKLVISMLESYSDRLSNDGCNDWRIPKNFTREEANVIHTLMCEFNEREVNPEIFNNIGVVEMLISKLKSGIK